MSSMLQQAKMNRITSAIFSLVETRNHLKEPKDSEKWRGIQREGKIWRALNLSASNDLHFSKQLLWEQCVCASSNGNMHVKCTFRRRDEWPKTRPVLVPLMEPKLLFLAPHLHQLLAYTYKSPMNALWWRTANKEKTNDANLCIRTSNIIQDTRTRLFFRKWISATIGLKATWCIKWNGTLKLYSTKLPI